MRFIHTADLHLDSPFDNLKNDGTPDSIWRLVYQSTYRSFARIVRAAVQHHVDFVLIVGDLFDRQTRSVKAQAFLKKELGILDQNQIPVLLSFGNHDYYSGDYHALNYPSNTYVFPQKVTTKHLKLADGTLVNVTGFSYGQRWETRRIINDFPEKGRCDYQIGMIHGQISSGASNYVPFSLAELRDKHYDYWALGHIHKRQVITDRPPVVYPGNIQGRNPNETGEKGYLLVDSDHQLQPEFEPTSVIDWTTLVVKIIGVDSEDDLINLVLRSLTKQNYQKMHLVAVQLVVSGVNTLSPDLVAMIENQNLLDQLQAVMQSRYQDVDAWIYNVDLKVNRIKVPQLDAELWQRSASNVFSVNNVDQVAKKLFQHPFINRRFNNPSAIKRLKHQITQLLFSHGSSQDEN